MALANNRIRGMRVMQDKAEADAAGEKARRQEIAAQAREFADNLEELAEMIPPDEETEELPTMSTYEATSTISKEEVLERLDNLTTDFAMKSAKIKVQGGVETLRFFADDFEKFVSNLDFLLDDIKRGAR